MFYIYTNDFNNPIIVGKRNYPPVIIIAMDCKTLIRDSVNILLTKIVSPTLHLPSYQLLLNVDNK